MDLSRDLEGQLLKRAAATDFTVGEDERTIEFPFSSAFSAQIFGWLFKYNSSNFGW